MVDRQLMLMSQINNLELLAFGSQELPEEERRFQRKYYLWGVFRSKQETTLPMKPLDQREVNYSLSMPPDMSRDDVYQEPRDSPDNLNHRKRGSTSQTYDTQLNRDQPHGSQTYDTRLDRDQLHGSQTYDTLLYRDQTHGSQTYDTRLDRGQPHGSHKRKSYHREMTPKLRKHRADETDGSEYDDRKTSHQSEVRRPNYRIREHDAKTFRTGQKDFYRSRGRYDHHMRYERYD